LLLFLIIPFSLLVPWVSSQNSTVTTTLTSVNQFSYANTISTPVQSLTSTVSGVTILVNAQATVTSNSPMVCAAYAFNFNAQAGQPVTGFANASVPLTLTAFILSDPDYSKWSSATPSYCDPTMSNVAPQWGAGGSDAGLRTKIAVTWTPKLDGKYWLVTESYSNAGVELITVQLQSPTIQTVTSVSYSVATQETVYATTQIMTSTTVEALSQPSVSQPNPGDMSMILLVLVVVVVAVAGVIVMLRRIKRTRN